MVDQLDCFRVQWERAVTEEKLHCMVVEFQTDGLQQGNVVPKDLLIFKVEAHANNLIYVVVAEQIEYGCFALYVLHAHVHKFLL